MSTISVGEIMELAAEQAARYAGSGTPDLDERVEAFVDGVAEAVEHPTVNVERFADSLFERLDSAIIRLEACAEPRRGHPEGDELQRQKVFFAAVADRLSARMQQRLDAGRAPQ